MWPSNERTKWKVESQADSRLSMIDTHNTPRIDIDKYVTVEPIHEIFRPDFTVYVQEHASTAMNYGDITDQTLKQASIETHGFVQKKVGEHSLASLMPLDAMFMTYSVPT